MENCMLEDDRGRYSEYEDDAIDEYAEYSADDWSLFATAPEVKA